MSPRPVRISGRVIACQRLDVSKRSDRRRWVLRVQLQVEHWQWLDPAIEPPSSLPQRLWLVAPLARWERLLQRAPQAGDALLCRSDFSGEAIAPMQHAAWSERVSAPQSTPKD